MPTTRGAVNIEYTQPSRRRRGNLVTTTIRIRNQSPHAIAGFQVSEVWYDDDGNVVTGGQTRFREPVLSQQIIDVVIDVPRDRRMERSNTEFIHQNGEVPRVARAGAARP